MAINTNTHPFDDNGYNGLALTPGWPATGFPQIPAGLKTSSWTTTAAQVFTLPAPAGVEPVFYRFDLANLGTETVGIKVSFDQTNYSEAPVIRNLSDDTLATTTALGNGTYYIPKTTPPFGIQITKSSATAVCLFALAWATVPRE